MLSSTQWEGWHREYLHWHHCISNICLPNIQDIYLTYLKQQASKAEINKVYLVVRFFVLCGNEDASDGDEMKLSFDDVVIVHEEVQQSDRQVDRVS